MKIEKKVIGIIPAAGYANRISPLPCSKEIYPISYQNNISDGTSSPKVASASLLEKFRAAGLKDLYMIIRKEKWDIPKYFGTGFDFGLNIAYIVTEPTPGTPHTIDKAFHFIKDKNVLFGFPDIQISHKNPFEQLLAQQEKSGADIVLGLFKTDKTQKFDMVEIDSNGMVTDIIIKPKVSNLKKTWLLATWNPVFTDFFHVYLSNYASQEKPNKQDELYLGDIIRHGLKEGLNVDSVTFPDSSFIDIGTIDDLKKAIRTSL